MSESDKMFEKLGYEKIKEYEFEEPENDNITELILYKNGEEGLVIEFWNDKTISKSSNYDESYLTMQELQAVHTKCKELGWIE